MTRVACAGASPAATRSRPRPIAAPATKAPRCRCSVSARCSFQPTATRSRRTPSRRAGRLDLHELVAQGHAARPAARAARDAAADRARHAGRARRARLPARQLRPVSRGSETQRLRRARRAAARADRADAHRRRERCCDAARQREPLSRPRGAADARLVVPGDPQAGTLLARMRSRDPRIQMPPLGTRHPRSSKPSCCIEHWIEQDSNEPTRRPRHDRPSHRALDRDAARAPSLAVASPLAASDEPAADAAAPKLAHGKYLVTIAGCNDCHTPLEMGADGPERDMTRMLSGHRRVS